MKIQHKILEWKPRTGFIGGCLLISTSLVGCGGSDSEDTDSSEQQPDQGQERVVIQGNDTNSLDSPLLSLNPQGPGGSPNQSIRGGDVLQGSAADDVIIGGLGVDVLLGGDGNDVLIGGTEDFNSSVNGDELGSDNRDRAFGGNGDDVFIWAPGDGSDFFDGGTGTDVLIFGILGELRDSDLNTDGAPFFNVNPPASEGSADFDGIFLDSVSNLPNVSVSTSPGFCSVLDYSSNTDELQALGLDHLVRFSLRSIANDFDAGNRTDDDGLRVSISLRNTEYVVCTRRDVVDGGGTDNIEVLDVTTSPSTFVALSDLPQSVQQQIQ